MEKKYEDIVFTPDPNYVSPPIKALRTDALIDGILWFAPGMEAKTRKSYRITGVQPVETRYSAYGELRREGYAWKGVGLDFEKKGGEDKFRMEIFRAYMEGKRLYPKQHGEIRVAHKGYRGVRKLGLDKAPLAVFLQMCAPEVRDALLKAAAKSEVFLFQDTPLEPAEEREFRLEEEKRRKAQREKREAEMDARYRERRKLKVF